MNAQSKGENLGVLNKVDYSSLPSDSPNFLIVGLLGRAVPALRTEHGIRGLRHNGDTVFPLAVERYLQNAFRDNLSFVRHALRVAAGNFPPAEFKKDMGRKGYDLYVAFRPQVPEGEAGWGAQAAFECQKVLNLGP